MRYDTLVTRAKRSVSLPPELEDAVAAMAAASGQSFSAWLADAARQRLAAQAKRAEALAAVAEWRSEYEAEHGPIPRDAATQARSELIAAGVLPPVDEERVTS